MKLLLIQLSDMHFENTEQTHSIKIDKMISAIKANADAEECIIIISGDLAAKGKKTDYQFVKGFIIALLRALNENGYKNRKIHILSVPGNHDIDYTSLDITIKDIIKAYDDGTIEELKSNYIESMKNYFLYATENECFNEDKIVSKKVLDYNGKRVGFVLLNTAPLSLLGGNAEDMGNHYLSESELKKIDDATDADINILVLHHSIEWLRTSYKEKMRKSITKKYSLVLSGHEHSSLGQSSCIDNNGTVQFIQGNALYGFTDEGNGFCTLTIDFDNFAIEGFSYIWKNNLYVPNKIIDTRLRTTVSEEIELLQGFKKQLLCDSTNRKVDEYYVFPGITYNMLDENDNIQRFDIDDERNLFDFLNNRSYTVITGKHKSGKSLLAKRLFRYFYEKGKKPLFIEASSINKKRIERTIDYIFGEEYATDDYAYEKYKQLEKSQRVAIIDEADMLPTQTLETLVSFLGQSMGQIIVFSEDKLNLNVRKQVVETLVDENELTLNIKSFLYDKRKVLIGNILQNSDKEYDVEKETAKINDLINMQVKYFNLDPEFIISFVKQYETDINFKFTAGMNVFNVVYESSIRNQIIANSGDVDPTHMINVLRELAYNMHFGKKTSVSIEEISQIAEVYKKEYRQIVNIKSFLDAVLSAKILIENNNEYRIRDHTIIAYFVAQALNQKYYQDEDIKDNLDELLRNLCFSINSDIVLFLALITNNPKFVNIIIEGAQKHFESQEELSFDRKNVEYILNTKLPIKDSLPDKEERKQRENEIAKQEENAKLADLIELVNEYDYTEEDLKKIENQIMISFKYLEILSKTLPAFCQNMKADQQDRLVELIYRCPNQFLYTILKDIGENFDEFTNDLYSEISILRKERNVAEISLQSVRRVLEQISSVLVIALYQLVASTCTNEQSILALNEFNSKNNSNYELQNLMMCARIDDIVSFSKKVKILDKKLENNLSKSIIRFTVRDYFLRNSSMDLHGEAQSLMDQFFAGSTRKNIQMNMAKKRLSDKDRT